MDTNSEHDGYLLQYYDIRKQCEGQLCYDFSRVDTFLNLPSVKEALGVHTDWVSCSRTVYDAMQGDWMKDLELGIPALLEDGVNVLIYAGEYDLICNWLGTILNLPKLRRLCGDKNVYVVARI